MLSIYVFTPVFIGRNATNIEGVRVSRRNPPKKKWERKNIRNKKIPHPSGILYKKTKNKNFFIFWVIHRDTLTLIIDSQVYPCFYWLKCAILNI